MAFGQRRYICTPTATAAKHSNGYELTLKPTTAGAFIRRSTTVLQMKCTSARTRARGAGRLTMMVEPTGRPELSLATGLETKMIAKLPSTRVRIAMGCALVSAAIWGGFGVAADQSGFPDGYDAVIAAPQSHRVIFENSLVRVLEVTVPPAGTSEPMHHHRWPGFFLDWDVGGKTNHLRYHRYNGSIRDIPSIDAPAQPGHWSVKWIEPEPMHAIETIEKVNDGKDLRVEIKISR